MGTKARVSALRNMQQQIAKLYNEGDEAEHHKQTVDAYRQLRITWERAVEEVLFRGVVLRFRKGISTQLLAGVVVDDADYACVEQSMTKCSNYAHDQASLGGAAMPAPDELLADINALDKWRVQVENRSKGCEQEAQGWSNDSHVTEPFEVNWGIGDGCLIDYQSAVIHMRRFPSDHAHLNCRTV